jgi:ribose transport system substrate-binding protein
MSRSKRVRIAAALLACSGALSACGSAPNESSSASAGQPTSADSVAVDVGTTKVNVRGPMKLAYFSLGTNNSYLQAAIKSVKESVAKVPGASVRVFDANFDASTQFNQIQNALQSKKYNAAIVLPVDPQLICNILTEQAPAEGMVVSVMTGALCGRTVKEGDGLWAPGTLDYVGGVHTYNYWKQYLDYVVEENPGPQKAVVLTGPKINAITVNLDKALEDVQAEHPGFKVVAKQDTDYSVPVAQQKMVPMIQAHPDATIFFSAYSNLTRGAMQALRGAGKVGKIKIYDKGATEWAIAQMHEGTIETTTPEHPVAIMSRQVELLQHAFEGKQVPRFVPNDGAPVPKGADARTGLVIVDQKAAKTFQPESD